MLRKRLVRPRHLVVTLLLVAAVSGGTTPAPATVLSAGMLPTGVHPLQVFDTASSSAYRQAGTPGPNVSVVSWGGSTATGGWQRQTYNLAPGRIEWVLLAANEPPVRPRGTYISEFDIDGIYFDPEFPLLWREVNAAGVVVADVPWSWTVTSSNGGVTLSQTSVARQPETEMVAGVPVLVQRVDTTMRFSGGATGTLGMTQWQAVGESERTRLHFEGTVTTFGARRDIRTSVVLNGLGGLPGLP